ncbi:hypothetical protein CC80DRAFT_532019 [Byssothecium circinans]|uniref:Uncharacterized protein n=1 Tax=Byssothecium circinans TaxID=147558 RepID=A0A6A5U8W2_9PLEO|nr:hypothetical protein CC80DRAFT_532019 [Byssothecium circinans]
MSVNGSYNLYLQSFHPGESSTPSMYASQQYAPQPYGTQQYNPPQPAPQNVSQPYQYPSAAPNQYPYQPPYQYWSPIPNPYYNPHSTAYPVQQPSQMAPPMTHPPSNVHPAGGPHLTRANQLVNGEGQTMSSSSAPPGPQLPSHSPAAPPPPMPAQQPNVSISGQHQPGQGYGNPVSAPSNPPQQPQPDVVPPLSSQDTQDRSSSWPSCDNPSQPQPQSSMMPPSSYLYTSSPLPSHGTSWPNPQHPTPISATPAPTSPQLEAVPNDPGSLSPLSLERPISRKVRRIINDRIRVKADNEALRRRLSIVENELSAHNIPIPPEALAISTDSCQPQGSTSPRQNAPPAAQMPSQTAITPHYDSREYALKDLGIGPPETSS